MNKTYKAHSALVFIGFCFIYGLIILKLYLIQIHQNSFFTNLGEQQYHINVIKYAPRALIYDRSKRNCLALNRESVAAFILPTTIKEKNKLNPFLETHFPHAYQRLQTNSNNKFMYIKRNLTEKQIELIHQSGIKDIQFITEPNRFYPIESIAQIVGITDIDNKGLFGIELQRNKQLIGTPSNYALERDARSGHFYFKKETYIAGKEGNAITLTIDGDLQFLVHQELKETVERCNAKEGSVIVMNPRNGEILAMANYPSFNPNDTSSMNLEYTKNKAITESYELGSVIKTFCALAALEEGVVQPDELINCKNAKTAYVDGRRINTWKAHGTIPFTQVIEQSNNIGIAIVAKRVGEKLYDHYTKLGFGTKTGIAFPGEQKGFVNPPWNWSKQSIISLSYGYEITATLLQLAKAMSIIANDGYDVQPKLIMDTEVKRSNPSFDTISAKSAQDDRVGAFSAEFIEASGRSDSNNSPPVRGEALLNNVEGPVESIRMGEHPKRLYSEETINTLKTILENTTLRGTTRRAAIHGYRIMTKTGTANLLDDNGQYNPEKKIYTCSGILEKGNYQRVSIVFVKEANRKNSFAATIAVPLFERIAEKILIHDRVL